MKQTNIDFLEEYKHLDKLCREIYASNTGISNYIEDMKQKSPSGRYVIQDWDLDLRQLIKMRHIRNQLTHDVGTIDSEMCSYSDIEWLSIFQLRLMKQTDPLSLLHKSLKPTPKKILAAAKDHSGFNYDTQTNALTDGCLPALLILVLIVVISLLIAFSML